MSSRSSEGVSATVVGMKLTAALLRSLDAVSVETVLFLSVGPLQLSE